MHKCQYCLATSITENKEYKGKPKVMPDPESWVYQVICEECGSAGPVKSGSLEAVEAWGTFQGREHKKAPE